MTNTAEDLAREIRFTDGAIAAAYAELDELATRLVGATAVTPGLSRALAATHDRIGDLHRTRATLATHLQEGTTP